jgi:hypothetical protein
MASPHPGPPENGVELVFHDGDATREAVAVVVLFGKIGGDLGEDPAVRVAASLCAAGGEQSTAGSFHSSMRSNQPPFHCCIS